MIATGFRAPPYRAVDVRDHAAPTSASTLVAPGGVVPRRRRAAGGGFRHSDTVAVTPDGIEILTDYPSDIESLTLPA
jgi:Xaa-Pro aminopeptidase